MRGLCLATGHDMHEAGETELARIWQKIDKIRAKQAAKPKHSPLPEAQPALRPDRYRNRQEYVPAVGDHVRRAMNGDSSWTNMPIGSVWTVAAVTFDKQLKLEGSGGTWELKYFDLITPAPTTAVAGEQGGCAAKWNTATPEQRLAVIAASEGAVLKSAQNLEWGALTVGETDAIVPNLHLLPSPTVPDAPEARP